MSQSFTSEQHLIFSTILCSVSSPSHSRTKLFFVNGKAGRGKTFVLDALIKRLRGEGRSVAVCGSTALSATLYPRGRTAHSLFGIPVTEDSSELHSRIVLHSSKANYLKGLDLIVWEELPMSNKACIECANKLMQDITGCSEPFGGKVVVALGDFRQVAPVVPNG